MSICWFGLCGRETQVGDYGHCQLFGGYNHIYRIYPIMVTVNCWGDITRFVMPFVFLRLSTSSISAFQNYFFTPHFLKLWWGLRPLD